MKINMTVLMLRILQWVLFFNIWVLMWPAIKSVPGETAATRDVIVTAVLLVGSFVVARWVGKQVMVSIISLTSSKEELKEKYGID